MQRLVSRAFAASRPFGRRVQSLSQSRGMSSRAFFVGGNWKANGSSSAFAEFAESMRGHKPDENEVVIALPSLFLESASAHLTRGPGTGIELAAQDCREGGNGAHTGETTADMLRDSGIGWTLVGHSERRANGETSELVAEKAHYALSTNLSVVPCVGETIDERNAGTTMDVVASQVGAIASRYERSDTDAAALWARTVIAYEPVWAIGTGEVATPAQAQEVHAFLRGWLSDNVSSDVADRTRIIYGGSVTGASCRELASMDDVDGFLVGGASLKPEFADIMKANV